MIDVQVEVAENAYGGTSAEIRVIFTPPHEVPNTGLTSSDPDYPRAFLVAAFRRAGGIVRPGLGARVAVILDSMTYDRMDAELAEGSGSAEFTFYYNRGEPLTAIPRRADTQPLPIPDEPAAQPEPATPARGVGKRLRFRRDG